MRMTYQKSKLISVIISVIILALLACLLMAAPVLAEGTGDGSGGKNIPLSLVSSEPTDGQKDVSLTGDIQLHFNKNVIYLLIRESNKKCFSLSTNDGKKVPIEVIMADDQTPDGFEKRRDISVRPLEKLEPGTAYILKISPDLQAKNGTNLGREVKVNFVAAGAAAKDVEPAMAKSKTVDEYIKPTPDAAKECSANTESPSLSPEKTDVSGENTTEIDNKIAFSEDKNQVLAEPTKATAKPAPKEYDQGQTRSNGTYVLITGIVIAAMAGYIYFRKKNQN